MAALSACVSTSVPGDDTGIELDKPALEISQAATANGPILAAGPEDGSVHAFWSQDNTVRRRVSMDGGLTFGPDELVLEVGALGNITAGQQQPQPLAAVVDDAGDTHLLIQIADPVDANRSDIYYDHVERYAKDVAKVLVTGGHDFSGVGQLIAAAYDPRTRQWEPVTRAALGSGLSCDADVPTAADALRRWNHAGAGHLGRVYVTGGENIGGLLSAVQYFDPKRSIWLGDADLPGPRAGHALVDDGEFLYAIGGRDAGAALGSIVRMSPAAGVSYLFNADGTIVSCTVPASGAWLTLGASLGVGREHLDAVIVARASGVREIYVIGGETFAGTPLQNVDAFRIDMGGVLTPIVGTPNLPTPRSRHRAVAVGERIYVMGGTSDGTDVLGSVQVLDLAAASPTWTSVSPMPGPRTEFAAAVLDGKVYVMAGRDALVRRTEVDVLDPVTEIWDTDPASTAPYLPLGAAAGIFAEPSLPRNLSRQNANATQPAFVRDPPSDAPGAPDTPNLYALWRDEAPVNVGPDEAPRTTADVYLRRSADNGATFFEPPVRLSGLGILATRNNNFSGNPHAAVGANGLVHTAWVETGESGSSGGGGQELIYTNCAPDDFQDTGLDCGDTLLTFAAATGPGPGSPPAGQMKSPAIAVDGAGGVYLAWIDADGTVPIATASANEVVALNVHFTWRRATGTFAAPVPIGMDITSRTDELFPRGSVADPVAEIAKLATRTNTPTIVADGAGEVNVLWANDSEVRLRRSKDGGRTFLNEVSMAPFVSGAQRVGPSLVYGATAKRLVALWQTLTASGLPAPDDIDSTLETRSVLPR